MDHQIVTFLDVQQNKEISSYISSSDRMMGEIGYTEHGHAHTGITSKTAADLLISLGYDERTAELASIAGYMHDIGNSVNRKNHAQSGALMAYALLRDLGMNGEELATVIGAIGNHDEDTGAAISPVAAALILSDKSDVRRSRVRSWQAIGATIHDRVNYAVNSSGINVDMNDKTVLLKLEIDTGISPLMDYFEIFLSRMLMCKNAAVYLGLMFKLEINGTVLL